MSYSVYVIELDPAVRQHKRFMEKNPEQDTSKPCLYVGHTVLTPQQRLANHRRGHKGSSYVKRYGRGLVPALYIEFNPVASRQVAELTEAQLAVKLRIEGYAVWQA